MDYETALAETFTAKEVERELDNHGFEMIEFTNDNGVAEEYSGEVVLGWLGY